MFDRTHKEEEASIRVEINVRINQLRSMYGPGSINLTETLDLPETDFLGLAAIMKEFHDLANTIKEQQRKKDV